MKDATVLVARILLAFMFIIAGWGKLGAGYAGTQQYMASMGLSGALLPLVIFAELGGGLGVLFGALTRLAAAGLAAFCILSAIFFHTNFADQTQSIMFMKNFAIAGGMLMLAVHGAGAWSLDAWWQARRS
ncbi:DoxX family protein [Aromatoleum toluclasticum]|uniref:DoxX family protein n=1 Tax=Aromatoleum toluclasticum TaxID=92003 RepID=UPI001D1820FC|nr:DoxX family protein [Aromatoleum toluclasticum]MCC4118387.1 DoxX family protein [Aromatoleum toluclasticum]